MTDTKVSYRGGYEQKEREGEMRDKRSKCCNSSTYQYERPITWEELRQEEFTRKYATKNTVTVVRCLNCGKEE